jgi:tRNA-dihydrouridine synthase 3
VQILESNIEVGMSVKIRSWFKHPQTHIITMDTNPLNPDVALEKKPSADSTANPQREVLPGDSAITKAEKVERHGAVDDQHEFEDSPRKRVKLENNHVSDPTSAAATEATSEGSIVRRKGVTPIKQEFLVDVKANAENSNTFDDDDAEAGGKGRNKPENAAGRGGKKTKGGQNKSRQFGSSRDEIQLCRSRESANEFSPAPCPFAPKCNKEHDLRKYLKDGKRQDLQTFKGDCPIFDAKGKCSAGWRCRFASAHSKEIEHEDGRKELVQIVKEVKGTSAEQQGDAAAQNWKDDEDVTGVVNIVSSDAKISLRKKKFPLPTNVRLGPNQTTAGGPSPSLTCTSAPPEPSLWPFRPALGSGSGGDGDGIALVTSVQSHPRPRMQTPQSSQTPYVPVHAAMRRRCHHCA